MQHTYVQGLKTGFKNLSDVTRLHPVCADEDGRAKSEFDLGELSHDHASDIWNRVEAALPVYSQTAVLACLLLQLYLFRLCEEGDFFPWLEENKFRHACKIVASGGRRPKGMDPNARLWLLYCDEFLPLGFPVPDHKLLGHNIVTALATELETSYKNYLNIAVPQLVMRFLRRGHGFSAKLATKGASIICDPFTPKECYDVPTYEEDRLRTVVAAFEYQLTPYTDATQPISPKDRANRDKKAAAKAAAQAKREEEREIKRRRKIEEAAAAGRAPPRERNPKKEPPPPEEAPVEARIYSRLQILYTVIVWTAELNTNREYPLKIPRIFPLRRAQLQFMRVDANDFNQWGYSDAQFARFVRAMMPKAVLRRMRALGPDVYTPPASFQTDGVRVCTTVKTTLATATTTKESKIGAKRRRDDEEKQTVLPVRGVHIKTDVEPELLAAEHAAGRSFEAFDPGKKAPFTGSRGTFMTEKEYARLVRRAEFNAKYAKLNRVMGPEPEEVSGKVASADELLLYLKFRVTTWIPRWQHYTQHVYGKLRFTSSILTHRALDIAANRLVGKDGKKIAVIGAAMFSSMAPTTRMKNHAGRKGLVITDDEYMSSQKCFGCKSIDEVMVHPPHRLDPACHCGFRWDAQEFSVFGQGRPPEADFDFLPQDCEHQRTVYSLFYCKSCNRMHYRDANAAFNIECAYVYYVQGRGDRPPYLARESNTHSTQ